MNTIGRVFIVLNLALAGTYVAFAGTYLQRDDDWKQKYTKAEEAQKLAVDDLNARLKAEKTKLGAVQMTNSGQAQKIAQLEVQLKEKEDTNVRLSARLSEMESAFKKTESYMATVSSKIDAAFTSAQAAQQMALAAEKEKDEAVAAKNASEKALAEANFKIKNQSDDIAEKLASIAQANATIKEKDVLLDIANTRFPGIFTTLHPHVTGSVSHISPSGSLLTIDLKTGADQLKGGHTFAIFNPTEGYKGEAVVTEIDSSKKFCFTRLTLKAGAKPAVGDQASTNVSVSGN